MTSSQDYLKKRIIALQKQNRDLKTVNRSLRRQSVKDAKAIVSQRDVIAKYQERLYPHRKYIAVHSAVVFEDKSVAFSIYTEHREESLLRSKFYRDQVNLSGRRIINMAKSLAYDTKIAFSKAHLRAYDASFKGDKLIPVDRALPQKLGDYARTQLTRIISTLKQQLVQADEAIIRNRNPLSEYDDNTNTLRYNVRLLAVRSAVVFSNKTVAFNVFAESLEKNLFSSDTYHRGHVNLSSDLITSMSRATPFRTNIVFTKAHLSRYDPTYNQDTFIPIDEMLPKSLCAYAIEQLGSVISSQFKELSAYRIGD